MLKIISRESKLAKIQVEELIELLPNIEFETEFIKSSGDKKLDLSLIDGVVPSDFFTKELDEMIITGKSDIAVHSAKDLPYPLHEELELYALTKSGNKTDSLVARDGLALSTLPEGSKVGTSSINRKLEILKRRPDLEIIAIRGDIGQRLEYVDRGDCDAIIVATCALNRLGLDDKISEILPIKTDDLQGNLAVIGKKGRFDLQAIFSSIDYRKKLGEVILVGAGPGDPELVTIKAEKAITTADIVFYDALINDELLTWINGEKVFVGKRKGEHSRDQNEINELLYKATFEYRKIVRLKCGDPLLFSRGGEEIDYLKKRFINVSVIPGISSFQGCASSLSMALTKRGESRSLTALSAHYEKPADIPVTESGTQVIFMGATKSKDIQSALINKGWSDDTPLRVISRGTFDDEEIFSGTIKTLNSITASAPAMIIVGEVTSSVRVKPKVLFTGLDPSRFSMMANTIHQPLIELSLIEIPRAKVPMMDLYEGFIFTSKAAVNYFFDKYRVEDFTTIVAIGPHTAKEIEKHGIKVDYIPEVFDSSHLGEIIRKCGARTWLYPCSTRSNNPIHTVSCVEVFPFYETNFRKVTPINLSSFSAIIFSSPSTVGSFLESYGSIPNGIQIIVYGKPTATKLESVGVDKDQIVISPIFPV